MEKGEVMYRLSQKTEVEVDAEAASKLVAQVLQADFDFISKEINEMKKIVHFSEVQVEDWNNNIEVRDAMKTLMRYYMIKSDYDEFMELQRVYGNVK